MSDWSVPYSDDEDLGGEYYEPADPNVIITLYESLQKGEIPQFQAPIYPRIDPQSENIEERKNEKMKPEVKTPEREAPEATEFDFDTEQDNTVKRFTPRRTPNRPETKKVAKMSKVFSDIIKYKKMDEEKGKEKDKQPQAK